MAQELATSGVLDPAASMVLYEAAHAARQAEEDNREVAESDLSQALRAVFGEVQQVEAVQAVPGGEDAARELAQAVRRVPMARRFHNDAVRAARALRRHRKVRWFRLALPRALPAGVRDGRRGSGRPRGPPGNVVHARVDPEKGLRAQNPTPSATALDVPGHSPDRPA